ncbi:MAG: type I-B CRISPR-associated protein Cas7/Cst2/DevR [bacterium]|nr:type I-B CRISPR-associated protein Cas7/Cst2/DevR [bacterium]
MDKRYGLTLTYIIEAFPTNYDEGYGNISVAKKIHRANGEAYLFSSRQSLRYSLINYLLEHNLINEAPLTKEKGVIQYKEDELKKYYYEEADLFGYMITIKGEKALTRTAPVRLSHLISLEKYYGDYELLNNKNFADRVNDNPNLANIETALNLYKYTLTIDLDKIGVDENFNINLSREEKIKRINLILEATKYLYRDIRGRRENLSPLFVIGGIYHIKSPFFSNSIEIDFSLEKPTIKFDPINQILNSQYEINSQKFFIKDFTHIGILNNKLNIDNNEINISLSPTQVIDKIKSDLEQIF